MTDFNFFSAQRAPNDGWIVHRPITPHTSEALGAFSDAAGLISWLADELGLSIAIGVPTELGLAVEGVPLDEPEASAATAPLAVGDKVRVVDDGGSDLPLGTIAEVIGVEIFAPESNDGTLVTVRTDDAQVRGLYQRRLEKVEEPKTPAPQFAVGDKVRVVVEGGRYRHHLSVGAVGEVTRVADEDVNVNVGELDQILRSSEIEKIPAPWYPDDRPGWTEIVALGCPVAPSAIVDVVLQTHRDGREYSGGYRGRRADGWNWHAPMDADYRIVAYRVVD
jgi:hypothetical protein